MINIDKPIIEAVRCFLIKDDKVICIKYLEGRVGYYDVPGGEIEKDETSIEAVKREFLEETGVEVINPIERGIMYVNRHCMLKIFIASEYLGEFGDFKEIAENTVEIREISQLLLEKNKYVNTILLEEFFKKTLLDLSKSFEIRVKVGNQEEITEIDFKVFDAQI